MLKKIKLHHRQSGPIMNGVSMKIYELKVKPDQWMSCMCILMFSATHWQHRQHPGPFPVLNQSPTPGTFSSVSDLPPVNLKFWPSCFSVCVWCGTGTISRVHVEPRCLQLWRDMSQRLFKSHRNDFTDRNQWLLLQTSAIQGFYSKCLP